LKLEISRYVLVENIFAGKKAAAMYALKKTSRALSRVS
jgi:hypothetical protein